MQACKPVFSIWKIALQAYEAIDLFWQLPLQAYEVIDLFWQLPLQAYEVIDQFWQLPLQAYDALDLFWKLPLQDYEAPDPFWQLSLQACEALELFWQLPLQVCNDSFSGNNHQPAYLLDAEKMRAVMPKWGHAPFRFSFPAGKCRLDMSQKIFSILHHIQKQLLTLRAISQSNNDAE